MLTAEVRNKPMRLQICLLILVQVAINKCRMGDSSRGYGDTYIDYRRMNDTKFLLAKGGITELVRPVSLKVLENLATEGHPIFYLQAVMCKKKSGYAVRKQVRIL